MPVKKTKKNLRAVSDLSEALQTAEKMKQKLFAKMQAVLDKKRMENLKKKMKV